MNKLLNTAFHELFKSKCFYVTILICAGLGIFFSVFTQEFPSLINLPEGLPTDPSMILSVMPSMAAIFMPFASSATAALLLDAQYNQGVIRNKLISGHTRTEVFLSGLIVSCAAAVIYFVVYQASVFSIAMFVYDYEFDLKATMVSLSVMLLLVLSVGTILSFMIGNMLRGGKMIVAILAVQYALNISIVLTMIKGDNKFLGAVAKFFPQSSMLDFSYYSVPELGQHAVIAAIVICALVLSGTVYFNKCDIK